MAKTEPKTNYIYCGGHCLNCYFLYHLCYQFSSVQLRPHITLQRTRSAPSRPHQLPLTAHTRPHPPSTSTSTLGPDLRISGSTTTGGSGLGAVTTTSLEPHYPHTYQNLSAQPPSSASPDPTDNDITDRLESLCLSVTEHALGWASPSYTLGKNLHGLRFQLIELNIENQMRNKYPSDIVARLFLAKELVMLDVFTNVHIFESIS